MSRTTFENHPRCMVSHLNGEPCMRPVMDRDCCPIHYHLLFNVKDKRYKLERGTQ